MKVIAKQFMILGGLLLTFNGMASQNSTVDLKYRVLVFRDSDVVVPGQRLPGGERILVAEGNLKGVPPWIGKHVPREARDILFPSVARLKMLQHSTWDIPEANATWDVFSLYRLNFWFILPTDVFDHFRDTRAQSNYFPRSLDFTVDSRYIEPEGARLTQAMIAAGFSPPVSM